MTTLQGNQPYEKVQLLLESISGQMIYKPGGGPGGIWVLHLWERTTEVEVRDNRVNRLDQLYVAKVQNPKTWEDYAPDVELLDDAPWKLVALFN